MAWVPAPLPPLLGSCCWSPRVSWQRDADLWLILGVHAQGLWVYGVPACLLKWLMLPAADSAASIREQAPWLVVHLTTTQSSIIVHSFTHCYFSAHCQPLASTYLHPTPLLLALHARYHPPA